MSANALLLQRRSIDLTPTEVYTSASPVRISNASFIAAPADTRDTLTPTLHTERLKCKDNPLVTRRGCAIVLQIELSTSINRSYTVTLTFIPVHGPRERSSVFKASGSPSNTAATGGSRTLWLSIELPSSFPVGYYDTHVSISLQGCAEVVTHMIHSAVVVLFNPWMIDDDTYLEDERLREQYCLQDTGIVWRGTEDNPSPRPWLHGQFETHCLDVAMMLLKDLPADDRRISSKVVQTIMSKIMTRDSAVSILLPSYTGHYGGGTQPCKWHSSVPIIQKYYRTRTSVKYGQCWVACAVAVTLLRCLGVPCRTVTCYEAAVPLQGTGRSFKNLSQIHRYFTPAGEPVYELEVDKIWSYHVLCECWMRRCDLPIGYDGWQVVGVSPSGHAPIGPLPVKAVRERQDRKMFGNDIAMLTAMLHSEVHYHRVNHSYATMSNRQCTLAKVLTNQCGRLIVTTDPTDSCNYIDITAEYKEGVEEIKTTPLSSPTRPYPYPVPSKDCSIEMTCTRGGVADDFVVTVTLTNNGPMIRTLDGRLVVIATQYNGDNPKSVAFTEFSGKITPKRNATVELPISSKLCARHSNEQRVLRLFILAKARETHQLFVISRYHTMNMPKLTVTFCTGGGGVRVGEEMRVQVTYRNILPSSLSHALFTIEGLGIHKEISYRRVILPGRQVTVETTLLPTHPGDQLIIANMYSDRLQDVTGSTVVMVT